MGVEQELLCAIVFSINRYDVKEIDNMKFTL